jgi:hypothetical protein
MLLLFYLKKNIQNGGKRSKKRARKKLEREKKVLFFVVFQFDKIVWNILEDVEKKTSKLRYA